MKKVIIALFSLSVILTGCSAQSGSTSNSKYGEQAIQMEKVTNKDNSNLEQNKDRQAIRKLNKQQNYGMVHKDVKLLRQITSKNAKFIHMDGVVQSRNSWINSVKTGFMTYYSGKTKSMAIELRGNTAKVIVHNEVTARINGTRGTWTLRSENNLRKVKGNWIITRSQSFSE